MHRSIHLRVDALVRVGVLHMRIQTYLIYIYIYVHIQRHEELFLHFWAPDRFSGEQAYLIFTHQLEEICK